MIDRILIRHVAAILLGLFAADMLYYAFIIPVVAAAAPTLLAFGAGFLAWRVWPHGK